jgi:chromosome segregation ATPase
MARTHALRNQEATLAAGREELEASRQAVDERAQAVGVREASLADLERQLNEREETVIRALAEVEVLRAQPRAAAPEAGPADEREAVRRLLELRGTVEATAQRLRLREGQAEQLLGEAMERAEEAHRIEAEVRAREARLDGLRVEIVNAKRALETVDEALTRMPYEIVDDFTKSGAFDAYENAVRVLKRFAEGPTA